jgi:hypothetical protein
MSRLLGALPPNIAGKPEGHASFSKLSVIYIAIRARIKIRGDIKGNPLISNVNFVEWTGFRRIVFFDRMWWRKKQVRGQSGHRENEKNACFRKNVEKERKKLFSIAIVWQSQTDIL